MSPFARGLLIALLAQTPLLLAALAGHVPTEALAAAGRAAIAAAGDPSPIPRWPTLPELLASALARLVPAIWAVLLPACLATALAAGALVRLAATTRWQRQAGLIALSPALLAAPDLGWLLLAALCPLLPLASERPFDLRTLALAGPAATLAAFLHPGVLPALPVLLFAAWISLAPDRWLDQPFVVGFLLLFPPAAGMLGAAYIALAFGASTPAILATIPDPAAWFRIDPLSPQLLLALLCPFWPLALAMRGATRQTAALRIAALGLLLAALAAATSPTGGIWQSATLGLAAALPLAAPRHGLPGGLARHAGALLLAAGFAPAAVATPPSLPPLLAAAMAEPPRDWRWREAIARASTLLEHEDAPLAAFAPVTRILPPGSRLFQEAEAGLWRAPQAVLREPCRGLSRLARANPGLCLALPPGYTAAIEERERRLLVQAEAGRR